MQQLYTSWGKGLKSDTVLSEYPRPHMVRDSYLNLNGYWEYAINKTEECNSYDGEILVPFSPEATLSGVNKVLMPDDYLHYRKIINIQKSFIDHYVLLHFGAVDQICKVYINDRLVGEHIGGYLPFYFDVTKAIRIGENEIKVVVQDFTETSYHARGKQKLVNKGRFSGMFYTPQSGIWQTVWMESVCKNYIKDIRITPLYDEAKIELLVQTKQKEHSDLSITISYQGSIVKEAVMKANKAEKIKLDEFKSWTPNNPCLYDIVIQTEEDLVKSYFGMRKYSIGRDQNRILRFMLNNKPYFHNGLLDQGYWPDGLYTAPTDEALKSDIIRMKELGFNTIRKHIKIEPARWYYHCDKIGMLVWQDMVNGGKEYDMRFVAYLPNVIIPLGRLIKDNKYKLFARVEEEGRNQYNKELREMIIKLYHFPSIAVWCAFNEGWGQFDANKATKLIRSIDKTRMIDETSGWFDQKGGDMFSIHNYWRKLKIRPNQKRVVALTEYGGYSYRVAGHSCFDAVYGYRNYNSKEELTNHYKALWEKQILPNLKNGLSAAIYTQITDVEEEVNGFLTYDREIDKMDSEVIKQINEKLYHMFDKITIRRSI